MEALKRHGDPFPKVPQELKDLPRWVLHKKKVPHQPNGKEAKSNDSRTWSTYEAVCEAFQRKAGAFSGIGFVLNGDGISCIDCDHCINTGEISPEVIEVIEEVNSYTEISPSGAGIHIWFRGNLPEGSGNRKVHHYHWGLFRRVSTHD